ncbi:hypothetical protein Cs7R123_19930 [Catellatospora sp. TT07R-123]|uniref:hypothetical protein n=1 Tax=Catellatospora sp. TT07R-123 TaxID=2733863 RepID=UPI001B0BA533|nr:hypothetical protein [Catellatospora sp. TT07R-123]GHJ44651.1 hypothetical protein Cs7R123_19930 [Catellatospora sp. TT07R-123]
MATEYVRELDVAQGYDATPDTHRPFGRIVGWVVGDAVVAPDLHTIDPKPPAADPGAPGGSEVFASNAVAVLSYVGWSTAPDQSITLRGRVSPANAQQLRMMAARSLARAVTSIAVVVYEYDPLARTYFPSLSSYHGTLPAGVRAPGGAGFSAGLAVPPVYARFGPLGGTAIGIRVAEAPAADPAGVPNVALEVVLAPPAAAGPQQFRLQSSTTVKRIQPWGLPQA